MAESMWSMDKLRELIEGDPEKTLEDYLRLSGLQAKERRKARRTFEPEMLPGGKLHDLVHARKLRLQLRPPTRPNPVDEALAEFRADAVAVTTPEPEPPEGMEAVVAIADRELTRAVKDALDAGVAEGEIYYTALNTKPRVAAYLLGRVTARHQAIKDKDRAVLLAETLFETCQRIEREVAELRTEMLESPDRLRQRLGVRQRPRTGREDEVVQ